VSWPLFFELLLGGVVLGGLYALMAFAFSVTLATTHILNVSHGVFMVLGAAFGTLLVGHLGVPLVLALVLVAAGFFLVGTLFQAVLVRPLSGRPPGEILVASILITFGLALALEALLGFYWARHIEPQPIFALTLKVPSFPLGDVVVSGPRAVVLAITAAAVGVFHLFLTRTRTGKELRAVSQNFAGALIVGVDPQRVSRQIFAIGIMAAAVAGAFYVMAIPLHPFEGIRLTLIAFTVTAVGGVGNLPGALWAGIGLGVAEVFTAFAIGSVWAPFMSLVVLFAVLLIRPAGLLGGRGA
jgi:branched-chain amino acid transport system permease protein